MERFVMPFMERFDVRYSAKVEDSRLPVETSGVGLTDSDEKTPKTMRNELDNVTSQSHCNHKPTRYVQNTNTHTHTHTQEAFEASWRGAPVVGQIIPSLGLPGVLTLILCVASFCQVYKLLGPIARPKRRMEAFGPRAQRRRLWSESRRLRLRIDTWDPSDGHEPKRRWQIWIRMSHLTDVGGLMLLHHLFKELVLIEVESSPDIWPIADRNASFEVKIFAESVPSLWFQISLFCLTFSDASFNNWLLTLISICTGTMTILHFLYLQTRVMLQLHRIGELWQIKETALIIAYVATLTSWVMCMVRLPGAWICPSHILNESGCVN
ncbi:unnamed protein product [Durusdinium trenchii]|uniref:Uncharacterized protein n=1 Tax=Durusdinium trenchii TaxID=1381693 RepID=A0ABP0NCI9_9DINO